MEHYQKLIRAKHSRLTDFEVERAILRNWERSSEAILECRYPQAYHRKRMIQEWNPDIDWHPWADRMNESIAELLDPEGGLKMGHWLGAQNSGKSQLMAVFLVQLLAEDPDYTGVYLTGPYREAARHGLWDYIVDASRKLCDTIGLDHNKHYTDSDHFFWLARARGAGFLRLTTCDKVGMLQGRKPRSPDRGYLILGVDETGVFEKRPGRELLDVLKNLRSPARFRGLTSCNFRDIGGLDGVLCRPAGSMTYDDLDPDIDQEWDAVHAGKVWRFDGHRSPNITDGEHWPYLLTQRNIDEMIAGGDPPGSPKYQEQIRSFPINAEISRYISTIDKIRAGNAFVEPIWSGEERTRLMFIDPSLGGDDFMVFLAEAKREEETGILRVAPVWMRKAEVLTTATFDSHWLSRLSALSPNHEYNPGAKVPAELQGAIQAAEWARIHGVRPYFIGYDGSMRASVQRAMDLVLGAETLSMDYSGKAPDQSLIPTRTESPRDVYHNLNTFLWFLAADMLENGAWREAGKIRVALDQLCSRIWEFKGNKKALETKEDYKARHANKSPNEADCLVGLSYLAYLRVGVFERGTTTPTGAGGVLGFLLERQKKSKERKERKRWAEEVGVGGSKSSVWGRRRSR